MHLHKLEKLRKLIADQDVGYYIIPTEDAHCSEYVSPCDKRREFISGFTGSAGTAVVGKNGYAELATDGRYWVQASAQLEPEWVLRREGSTGVASWSDAICARTKAEKEAIGVDPRLITYQLAKKIMSSGATLKAIDTNLVDQLWKDRPAEPSDPVFKLSTVYSGQSTESKLADLRREVKEAGTNAIVLSALDQIAWLLNLRGSDVAFNPVFKSYLILTQDETVLYISPEHALPPAEELGPVTIKPYSDVFTDLTTLTFTMEKKVWVPPNSSWALVKAAGVYAIMNSVSPVEEAKARKNPVEISNAAKAHLYCGISVTRLLSWLQQELRAGRTVTEFEASEKLQSFRVELPEYRGPSFETISSSGPNAAVIHYSPSREGSRKLSLNEGYLVDSGSQFLYGTTDTTRTAWFGTEPDAQFKEAYTLVLKGHIALASAVFRQGTSGFKLDILARQPMAAYGYDFSHSTGHGVGSYLNVHEGPIFIGPGIARSSHALETGNVISNEPGIYVENKFGIRIESLMAVEPAKTKYSLGIKFLKFRVLTVVPFDRDLIDPALLDLSEISWINDYSSEVRRTLEPHLHGADLEYLRFHTRPISK